MESFPLIVLLRDIPSPQLKSRSAPGATPRRPKTVGIHLTYHWPSAHPYVAVISTCEELGIAVIAYSCVLCHGLTWPQCPIPMLSQSSRSWLLNWKMEVLHRPRTYVVSAASLSRMLTLPLADNLLRQFSRFQRDVTPSIHCHLVRFLTDFPS